MIFWPLGVIESVIESGSDSESTESSEKPEEEISKIQQIEKNTTLFVK